MIPPLAAIFAWPLVGLAFTRKMQAPLAVLATLLGGFLLLPETISFDLPVLPKIDKHSIPSLTVLLLLPLVAARVSGTRVLPGLLPRPRLALLMILALVAGAFLTVLSNGDPQVYGSRVLPGLRLYDSFSTVLSAMITLLPLVFARKFLADRETHRLFLGVLCVAGLAYSLLALFEVRMAPQLNEWFYGFFPHSFAQHIRGGGGFRPIVFLSHGLVVSLFFAMTVLATAGLARVLPDRRGKILLAAAWLLLTLFLTKSLGAFAIAVLLLPVALLTGVRLHLLAASILAGIVLLYPVARGTSLVPLDRIEAAAEAIDEQRASSLRTRFANEEAMLEKAQERPLLGWGGWGRWRVYDELGRDITISDGHWVIVIGAGGWVGYLAEFGLLAGPILLLFLRRRRHVIDHETGVLALVLAANLVDLIPNSGITPLTWMLAGSLWGRLELGRIAPPEVPASARAEAPDEDPDEAEAERDISRYRRHADDRQARAGQARSPEHAHSGRVKPAGADGPERLWTAVRRGRVADETTGHAGLPGSAPPTGALQSGAPKSGSVTSATAKPGSVKPGRARSGVVKPKSAQSGSAQSGFSRSGSSPSGPAKSRQGHSASADSSVPPKTSATSYTRQRTRITRTPPRTDPPRTGR